MSDRDYCKHNKMRSYGACEECISEKKVRPKFTSIFMDLAFKLAERSTCVRRQVGCVVTSEDFGEVFGIGYNGSYKGGPNGCDSFEPGNCGCFPPNVKVETKDGRKTIQDIKVGDLVLTHKGRYRKVKKVLKKDTYNDKYIQINSGNTRGNKGKFISTRCHPILVERFNKISWMRADQILPDDIVFFKSRECEKCSKLLDELDSLNGFCRIKVKSTTLVERSGPIYNLEVEEDNSYVCQKIVVHNCLHAEDNALLKTNKGKDVPKIIFVTTIPCVTCAKRIINKGGVTALYFVEDYRCMKGRDLLMSVGISVYQMKLNGSTYQ